MCGRSGQGVPGDGICKSRNPVCLEGRTRHEGVWKGTRQRTDANPEALPRRTGNLYGEGVNGPPQGPWMATEFTSIRKCCGNFPTKIFPEVTPRFGAPPVTGATRLVACPTHAGEGKEPPRGKLVTAFSAPVKSGRMGTKQAPA